MKKSFKVLFVLVICCFAFFQSGFVSSNGISNIDLSNIIYSAQAGTENCTKSTYVGKQAKTGSTCFCSGTGKFVTPQTCETGSGNCTEIEC